jgi:tetratricopeptide (TPR) repeat protein
MRPMPLVLLLAACAGPGADAPPAPVDPTRGAALPTLAPGTVVAIAPCAGAAADRVVVDGLLREALRQSSRLDFAGGIETCDAAFVLAPAIDADASRVAVALEVRGAAVGTVGAPLPITSVRYEPDGLAAAIDALAWTTRRALGDAPDAQPLPVAAIYSSLAECVRLTEQAAEQDVRGADGSGYALLTRAQRADPGCAFTRAAIAAAELDAGRADRAAAIASETLASLPGRLSPTTAHKLARIALLARASRGAPDAGQNADTELLALGDAARRDRPHDPHGRYTRALALAFLGRFAESLPSYRALEARWPRIGWVGYHRAFAELACGDAEAALDAIERAARRLPSTRTVLPMTLALWASERHDELDRYLTRLADAGAAGGPDTRHEILRIQASHAILTGRTDRAAELLLADLEWMRQRPSRFEALAMHLVEAGEALVHLGHTRELGVRLAALHEIQVDAPSFRDALVYLSGLLLARETRTRPETALATLTQKQQTTWVCVLEAAVHHERGELVEEARQLATAIRITDSALVRVRFAAALRTMGRGDDADRLLADLREQLLAIRLRRPLDHALLNPAHAVALLATEPG